MNPTNRRLPRTSLPPDVLDTERDGTEANGQSSGRGSGSGLPSGLPTDRSTDRSTGRASDRSPRAPHSPHSPHAPAKAESRLVKIGRTVLGIALVVLVSWGVAFSARRYVMTSARFGITAIVVDGNHHLSTEAVAAEGKITKGANIFMLDLDEARARLAASPWIHDVTLARRLPGTILIQINEREPAALVALGETYLASREGEIFKRWETGDPADFPVLTGISSDDVAEDREGVARTVRRALDLAGDYERSPLGGRAELQEIHLDRDGSTTIVLGKSGLVLALGSPPFRRKLDQAARVMTELDRRGARADTVMLDNDARPERVVVRMR